MTKISKRYMLIFLASPLRQHALIRRYVSHAIRFPTRKSYVADTDRRDFQGEKTSHITFFRNRDWMRAENFWTSMVKQQLPALLPAFVQGDNEYGLANLHSLHSAGLRGEFSSSDYRYSHRQTFALRLG